MTGIEQATTEQKAHWRAAFLAMRNQLSELVEIAFQEDEFQEGKQLCIPHSVVLVLNWCKDTLPFFDELDQMRDLLEQFASSPIDMAQEAAIFVGGFIAYSKLSALLESFEKAQLRSIAERVVNGQEFLEVLDRAKAALGTMGNPSLFSEVLALQ
jgi:hypothetical protein